MGNIQNDLDELGRALAASMHGRDGSALDAYLIAAGMNQIAEDALHKEVYPFDRAAELLDGQDRPPGRIAGRGAAALGAGGRSVARQATHTRRVLRGRCVGAARRWARRRGRFRLNSEQALVPLMRHATWSSRRSRKVAAAPAARGRSGCRRVFRTSTSSPATSHGLVRDFSDRWPLRSRPLLVVGVRTSGSYLAPLCAAYLRAAGYEHVQAMTIRPGRRLLPHERKRVRSVARDAGLALVTDDPPVTGKGLARSSHALEAAGLPAESVVLLLQALGHALPASLDRYQSVVLPWDEWAIRARLTPEATGQAMSAFLGPSTEVLEVEALPTPPRPPRSHCRALFRARLRAGDGTEQEREVVAEGIGLGYLGSPQLFSAGGLDRFYPKSLGSRDGLLYREWLPEGRRLSSDGSQDDQLIAEGIAAYVSERHRAVPVDDDVSLRLIGQDAAWEVVSRILSSAFGRAWPFAKVLFIDRVAKRLLTVEEPSVVDGGTDLDHWFFGERLEDGLVKAPSAEGPFSNIGLSCFDPAFDLAGATASALDQSFAGRLCATYAELGNPPVEGERLVLYELAHLWRRGRKHPEEDAKVRRARSDRCSGIFATRISSTCAQANRDRSAHSTSTAFSRPSISAFRRRRRLPPARSALSLCTAIEWHS